jgi:hypothetical protein
MTQISSALAARHDYWSREPAVKHVAVALQLWWRHLQCHHPILIELLEWTTAATVALALVTAELIVGA